MEIDLKSHEYLKFFENLSLDKKINFIFGKNGTGKSTIADLIKEQYSDKYDIRLFQGFNDSFAEHIDENGNLIAFALDTNAKENEDKIVKIQKEIDDNNSKIKNINKEIERPEDKTENLFIKHESTNKEYDTKNKEIERFYTNSASEITELLNLGRSYNRNNFQQDIENKNQLQDTEIEKLQKTIKDDQKEYVRQYNFPDIDLQELLSKANALLQKQVVISQKCVELDTSEKENFVKAGKGLHKSGDSCLFCGNVVTTERLEKLNQHFNEEYQKLESEIKSFLNFLPEYNPKLLEQTDFYSQFEIKEINSEIKSKGEQVNNFITKIKEKIQNKQNNITNKLKEIDSDVPSTEDLSSKVNKLIDKNNEFGKNISKNKEHAEEKLRLHYVYEKLQEFDYDKKITESDNLKKNKGNLEKQIKTENSKINDLKNNIKKLKSEIEKLKPTAEKVAVGNINKRLKDIVNWQISIDENNEYYQIVENKKVRNCDKLSTGEKNIIAFLYFIEKLNETNGSNKTKVVIFDDPMNSNDDTMQYLIINEINKIIKNTKSEDKLICLTHNIFFYLNCSREYKYAHEKGVNPYDENNFYKFLSDGDKTTIKKISDFKDDYKTNYESFWEELVFLYNNNKAQMMWNVARRIIESYENFNGTTGFYSNNRDIKNMANTNSHGLHDNEHSITDENVNDVKSCIEKLFKDNNEKDHFERYWKKYDRNTNQ